VGVERGEERGVAAVVSNAAVVEVETNEVEIGAEGHR
jgi:hypothetical protein